MISEISCGLVTRSSSIAYDQIAPQINRRIAQIGLLIAAPQSSALGSSAGKDLLHQHAVIGGQSNLFGEIGPDGQRCDAQRWPAHPAILGVVRQHRLDGVHWDGETDAGTLFCAAGGDQGIHADDLTARVQQRAAGVAGIDRRIGLQGVFDGRPLRLTHRANGADDSRRHGAVQSKGIADSVDILAHLQVTRFGKHSRGQVGGVDLQQGKVMCLVLQNDLRLILVLVAERYLHLLCIFDHMVVGEDAAVFAEDEARALS